MKLIFKTITALVFSVIVICGHAAETSLDENDFEKLIGSWVGEREWKPLGQKEGAGRYERLNLEIKANKKSVITPEKKPNKKIKGPVVIRDGKVFIKFMKQQMAFTYTEKGGKSILSTKFEHKGDGKPFINELVFTK